MALSGKRQRFVEEYLKDLAIGAAGVRAGYTAQHALSLMQEPEIRDAIKQFLQERVMTTEEVLSRLSQHARGESAEYLRPDGTVDLERLLMDKQGHLIKAIRQTQTGVQVEFYDSQAALALIGKHLQLFTDRVELQHSGSVKFSADDAAQADQELEEWAKTREFGEESNG